MIGDIESSMTFWAVVPFIENAMRRTKQNEYTAQDSITTVAAANACECIPAVVV